MSRALLILSNPTVRQRAITWIKNVPDGTRVEFKEPKRTLPQNDRMWAILTEISSKALLGGQKYTPDEWKCIFLDALGQEMKFLPKLSGQGFLPLGHRSSELSVSEMSQLMELMEAWCAQNGVTLTEPKEARNGKIYSRSVRLSSTRDRSRKRGESGSEVFLRTSNGRANDKKTY